MPGSSIIRLHRCAFNPSKVPHFNSKSKGFFLISKGGISVKSKFLSSLELKTFNKYHYSLLCKEELLPNLTIHGPELQASFKFNREKTISDSYVGRFENV